MIPAGVRQMDRQDDFDDAPRTETVRRGRARRVGTVLTAVNDAARRLRRWPTAIIDRGSARRWWNSGRDEETARSQTKKQMRLDFDDVLT
jgi:hypothetical protein